MLVLQMSLYHIQIIAYSFTIVNMAIVPVKCISREMKHAIRLFIYSEMPNSNVFQQ